MAYCIMQLPMREALFAEMRKLLNEKSAIQSVSF